VHALGAKAARIDPDLGQDLPGQRMYLSGLEARAEHLESMVGMSSQQCFGHLAAGGVVGAEEKYHRLRRHD
jgi:hypothetical protein